MANIIIGRTREASGVINRSATRSWSFTSLLIAQMLTDDQEPRHTESGCVSSIDERVEGIDKAERQAMKWTLGSDVRGKVGNGAKCEKRIDVHAELERRKMKACQEREEAIEAGDLVEKKRKRYELCACT